MYSLMAMSPRNSIRYLLAAACILRIAGPVCGQSGTWPGEYTVEVGLYDAASGQRLPAFDEGGQPLPGDRVWLGHVTIP